MRYTHTHIHTYTHIHTLTGTNIRSPARTKKEEDGCLFVDGCVRRRVCVCVGLSLSRRLPLILWDDIVARWDSGCEGQEESGLFPSAAANGGGGDDDGMSSMLLLAEAVCVCMCMCVWMDV